MKWGRYIKVIPVLVGVLVWGCVGQVVQENAPRVFIFTDVNIDQGDPDDRQSLVHLMWYANEVEITGIVPDRWDAGGYTAVEMVLDAYARDYEQFGLGDSKYPKVKRVKDKVAKDTLDAIRLFKEAASITTDPLYVLVWGNMEVFSRALMENPAMAPNIRLITIGTGLMLEEDIPFMPEHWPKSAPCEQLNWNGFGREKVYNTPNFKDLWWVEMNWTYAGMFTGEEPGQMFHTLAKYGKLGKHIKEVVRNHEWAQYFRVGDTPSLLYVLDPGHSLDNPTESSWAGKYIKPFPDTMANYYTDIRGPHSWDYGNPCATWENHTKVAQYAKGSLEAGRPAMYEALLRKLDEVYGANR
ncbi:MAG: nucleoside hydrolase-like domain-containing protein [Bacteroidota bacterium]